MSTRRLITINPETLPNPTPVGYSHIRVDTRTKVAHVSGQLALNAAGEVVGKTLQEQLEQVERNLRSVLNAVRASTEDIIVLNIFVVDLDADRDLPVLSSFGKRMGNQAGTWIGVTGLALKGLMVEVEMQVAVVGEFVDE